jgi:hypothetical protein
MADARFQLRAERAERAMIFDDLEERVVPESAGTVASRDDAAAANVFALGANHALRIGAVCSNGTVPWSSKAELETIKGTI